MLRRLLALCPAVCAAWMIVAGWLPACTTPIVPAPSPMIACNGQGVPSDPVNVVLVGTREEIAHAMESSGWLEAHPTGVASGMWMSACVAMHWSYRHAPVSRLYLWDRQQDAAFERQEGGSPRRRHHVRLWRSEVAAPAGRSGWGRRCTTTV